MRDRYGKDFKQWWESEFGYGLDRLTESEFRYLAKVKLPPTESVRDRITAARQARDRKAVSGTGGDGRSPPVAPRDTETSPDEIARVPQATAATPHLHFASFGIRCGSDQDPSALYTVVRLTLNSCAMRASGTP